MILVLFICLVYLCLLVSGFGSMRMVIVLFWCGLIVCICVICVIGIV